jgi:hypothetical protein
VLGGLLSVEVKRAYVVGRSVTVKVLNKLLMGVLEGFLVEEVGSGFAEVS